MIDFLQSLLMFYPRGRMSAQESLESSFFKEYPQKCQPILLPTYPELRNHPSQENKKMRKSSTGNRKEEFEEIKKELDIAKPFQRFDHQGAP